MIDFVCPVCGEVLRLCDKTYKCKNNHSFDLSKNGYVNLFQGKGVKIHGDDKVMIKARTDFLEGGFYENLRTEICRLSDKFTTKSPKIIDCGCGECYYTEKIHSTLLENGKSPEISGIDISKFAIISGAKRSKALKLCVGSVFHLPFKSGEFDLLVTLFAPFCREEYLRVLKDNGIMIMAIPLENHLWELKQAIYEKPYKNKPTDLEIEGFELVEKSVLKNRISLYSNAQIQNLFSMTPYYYKTSHTDRQKLEGLDTLETQTEFMVLVYQKKGEK